MTFLYISGTLILIQITSKKRRNDETVNFFILESYGYGYGNLMTHIFNKKVDYKSYYYGIITIFYFLLIFCICEMICPIFFSFLAVLGLRCG